MNDMQSLTQDIAEEVSSGANTLPLFFDKLSQALPLSKVLSAIVLLMVCMLATKLMLRATNRILVHSRLEKSLHSFLRSVVKVLLVFISIMVVAGALGINTSSLLAILSVAGLAVSLSIQNTLSNLAGGIMILLSKPFKVDDYIKAGGVEGTVKEIGIIYTKLATIDNCIVHVPNSSITAASITNYSAEGRRRIDLEFTASYDSPIETVKAALKDAVNFPLVLTDIEPQIYVKGYGDSVITYLVRVWATNADYWTAYYQIIERVKACFDEQGVIMSYPHLNVHLDQ